jgi:polyisoprenoid-binding protein YceI
MINVKFVLVLFALILTARAEATDFVFKAANGKVSFLAVGRPSAIKIKGEGAGAEGVLHDENHTLKGEVKFDLSTLTTGIEMRDHHMKEKYLETPKFPVATLKLTDLKVPAGNSSRQSFSGLLTLRGIEKPVTGTFSTTEEGREIKADASFSIKLTDFKIEIPSYLGVTVAEDVQIEVQSTVEKK